MKNTLKDYFHYTRSERKGFLLLTLLGLGLLFVPRMADLFNQGNESTNFTEYETQIDEFLAFDEQSSEPENENPELFRFNPNMASVEDLIRLGLSEKTSNTIQNYRNKGGRFYKKEDLRKIYGLQENDYKRLEPYVVLATKKQALAKEEEQAENLKPQTFELFEFDPNTISREDIRRLGISERVANTMLNFRKQGGTFRKREDLSKIYGLSDEDYERLFPYIKIELENPPLVAENMIPKEFPQAYEQAPPIIIEINTAAPEEWQKLRGIGPYYAEKICNFRTYLGGFYNIDQIAETRGLPDSTFVKIRPFLVLNEAVKRININEVDEKTLAYHPYLKKTEAKAIIKYRDQHGPFKEVAQLGNILALKKETLEKITPYLSTN